MLVTEAEYTVQNFVEIFKKKFINFCNKAPVLLSFDVNPIGVVVKEQGTMKVKEFKFDREKTVKQNIKIIKDWLVEETYPIMIHDKTIYEEYTPDELEVFINRDGIPPEQAVLMRKEKSQKTYYRIEKVIVKKDELFVRNMTSGKQYRYKMGIPSTIFLKKMRETWTPAYSYTVFESKAFLLNEIYEIDTNEDD